MPSSLTLSSQLQAARLRQFVGRDGECTMVQSALDAPELPFFVLHVFGPGGVGKSFLLKHIAALAGQAGAMALHMDGRNVEPTSSGFVAALRNAAVAAGMDVASAESDADVSASAIWAALRTRERRCVILVDTYETLAPLDGWLRDELLPTLPENVLLVLAGRQAPSSAWRADPVWNTLIRAIPLRNLNPGESRAYLAQRNIPDGQHQAVLEFTHGHPLALSLVADTFAQRGNLTSFSPEETPDVIKALLERFVQKVPSPAHRAALEACALVRTLTEGLLCQMLNVAEAHELFEWLRELSFIESGRSGLFPHDLAREAIAADVRWRNPDWYAELHKRARAYYNARLQQVQGAEQQRALLDFTFLHRDNAIVRQYVDWQESGSIRVEQARPTDAEDILEMIRAYEGDASAQRAAHWLTRQPEGALALRESNQVVGYLIRVALESADETDLALDPVAHKAWLHARKHAPLRSGEVATLFRFWGARENYQQVGPVQSLAFISAVQYYLTTPRLAYTLFACADPDFWELLSAYADLERVPDLEWDENGRHFGIFAHDWRVTTPAQWLELLAERETALNPLSLNRPKPAAQVIALSEPDFVEAMREALRLMSRSQTLRGNALLGSRLVLERTGQNAGEPQRIEALRKLITETAETLQATPRDLKLYRAFYHTYLKPAASQEQAAEILDVPFSTYRRHLQAAIERITDLLWHKELGE
jgi:hypothetical protein